MSFQVRNHCRVWLVEAIIAIDDLWVIGLRGECSLETGGVGEESLLA